MQQLEQCRGDGVVVSSVKNLERQQVECSDQLTAHLQLGHTRLQQDQHDHVHQIVQKLGTGQGKFIHC